MLPQPGCTNPDLNFWKLTRSNKLKWWQLSKRRLSRYSNVDFSGSRNAPRQQIVPLKLSRATNIQQENGVDLLIARGKSHLALRYWNDGSAERQALTPKRACATINRAIYPLSVFDVAYLSQRRGCGLFVCREVFLVHRTWRIDACATAKSSAYVPLIIWLRYGTIRRCRRSSGSEELANDNDIRRQIVSRAPSKVLLVSAWRQALC